ncbi:MAG: dihydroneopterin aldolase [Saprospiraceae bacterium]|nr:dihydroneopterin aldolase [Saprospiraceae bacterium]
MPLIVGFEQLSVHAPIGLYPEEKILGNDFLVDLKVAIRPSEVQVIEDISQTIDYGALAEMTANVLKKGSDLIETCAQKIIKLIQTKYPETTGVSLKITKVRPITLPRLNYTVVQLDTGYFERKN